MPPSRLSELYIGLKKKKKDVLGKLTATGSHFSRSVNGPAHNPQYIKCKSSKKTWTLEGLVFQILCPVIATCLAYRHKSSPTPGSQANSCILKNVKPFIYLVFEPKGDHWDPLKMSKNTRVTEESWYPEVVMVSVVRPAPIITCHFRSISLSSLP